MCAISRPGPQMTLHAFPLPPPKEAELDHHGNNRLKWQSHKVKRAWVLGLLLGGELLPIRNIHFRLCVCKKQTSILFEPTYNFGFVC